MKFGGSCLAMNCDSRIPRLKKACAPPSALSLTLIGPTDAAAVSYFERYGMPMSPALREMTGKPALAAGPFFHDPRLKSFRAWAHRDGQRVYVRYLLSHPKASVLVPGSQLVALLSPLAELRWLRLIGRLVHVRAKSG